MRLIQTVLPAFILIASDMPVSGLLFLQRMIAFGSFSALLGPVLSSHCLNIVLLAPVILCLFFLDGLELLALACRDSGATKTLLISQIVLQGAYRLRLAPTRHIRIRRFAAIPTTVLRLRATHT